MQQKRALVVGNTDGIGLALTQRLLSESYFVLGISRRDSTLEHPAYQHSVCDVSTANYAAVLSRLVEESGPFDLCVYCAGIGELFNPHDMSLETQVFKTNLLGLVDTVSVLLPVMAASGRGHFIGISSIADVAVNALAPSYSASKAALSSYLSGLALAFRPYGVVVSHIRLGFVDTKMAKSSSKPLMISAQRATSVLMACVRRPTARVTYPWLMDVLVRITRWVAMWRLTRG